MFVESNDFNKIFLPLTTTIRAFYVCVHRQESICWSTDRACLMISQGFGNQIEYIFKPQIENARKIV